MKMIIFKNFTLKAMLLFTLLQTACTYNHLPESNKKIILNWYTAPANQTKEEYTTGLMWLLSYLGAKLPSSQFEQGIKFISDYKIEMNIDELGFTSNAKENLMHIINAIKQSEEYKNTGGIDAGRFFALCFNSTYHYYKITGAAKNYNEFSARYATLVFKTFVCDTSSISPSSRIIKYSISDLNIQKSCFIAEEGNGVFSSGNYIKTGIIEAFDYMENGQPRFVIYDKEGNLYAPSNPTVHKAGKPAKCMWCHESGMQTLYSATPDLTGSATVNEFKTDQQTFMRNLLNFHQQSNSKLNFLDPKAHTQGEYIYLSFYEPNANRLSQEWNMSLSSVKSLLTGIATHDNPEFPFLKEVYHRQQIQQFAPFSSVEVSNEMREATNFEPNLLK
jgi:hypothetical protein